MEYNGVKVLFKNGKTIKFIDWIAERDFSKSPFISVSGEYAINLAEVLHIKACKIAELKKTNNGK